MKPPRPRQWLLVIVALIGVGLGAWQLLGHRQTIFYDFPLASPSRSPVSASPSSGTFAASSISAPAALADIDRREPLPSSIRIQVPFASQAPLGDWRMPYQEACEEASLILVHHFLQGKAITPEAMDREILALADVETRQFGFGPDITLAQLGEVAENYYGYDAELLHEFDAEDLKRLLAAGHPIIAPFAGRQLGNPYYSGQGPWYHMLVITGYDGDDFITNDVGTRRGEGYRYRADVLLRAIHDWNGANEEIGGGSRVIMVVKRKDPTRPPAPPAISGSRP